MNPKKTMILLLFKEIVKTTFYGMEIHFTLLLWVPFRVFVTTITKQFGLEKNKQ